MFQLRSHYCHCQQDIGEHLVHMGGPVKSPSNGYRRGHREAMGRITGLNFYIFVKGLLQLTNYNLIFFL